MHCNNWIFDMDGTLTDSMTVVLEGAPDALLARYGRTPKSDLHKTLLTMGMADGAAYLIREYDLPLKMEDYNDVMWDVITKLYETVELKPGVRELLARLKAEGASMCICSNTWSAQCRTVLTRLGIDEYFDFYVEAQGALHKSRPDVFFQTLARLGGTDPDRCVVCEDSLYAARTAHDAGFHVIGIADAASKSDEPALREVSDQFLTDWTTLDWNKVCPCTTQKAARRCRPLSFLCDRPYPSKNAQNAALTAGSRPRGMGTRAPLRIQSSPEESWAAAARLTT